MRIVRRCLVSMTVAAIVAMVGGGVWLWHSGYRAYVVHTGSMAPTYKPGSLVIDSPAKDRYHPGEVITFRHSALTADVVTHRITDITSSGLIHTKGDANLTADVWDIRPNQVRGAVLAGIPFAGFVIVYLQQPAGIASVVTALIGLILLWGLCFPAADGRLTFLTPSGPETEQSPFPADPPRLKAWRPWRTGRPAASRAATTTATVAVAGMLVVNVAGGLTVLADRTPPPPVSEQAAVR